MSVSTLSSELLLLIAQQLESQNDLKALIEVDHRFYQLLKHVLYRYDLHRRNGDGVLRAAKLGSISAVAQFIEEGYRVRFRPAHSQEHLPNMAGDAVPCSCRMEHPILNAAEYGHSALVKYLLSEGSEPALENNLGQTPLHLAAKNGFLSVIKILLSGSTFPTPKDTNFALAPIKEAAFRGHTHVVEYFLSSLSSPNNSASSSLPFAAASGDTALVSVILGYGANINHRYIEFHGPRVSINPEAGRGHESSALSVAARHGHLTLMDFLLNHGAKVNLKTGLRNSHLWKTPLSSAVRSGHVEVIKTLLAHSAKITEGDLCTAIWQSRKEALKVLLAKFEVKNCHFDLLDFAEKFGDVEFYQSVSNKGFGKKGTIANARESG
ncbi:uncharacterized protein N7511_006873 [Penicillium nucicola]|uniref:uncharacterized protein n=1 Tax=Penicillium nucicola TaxID=1850975 RepID=UPI0025459EEE|nr:uncharacterized protein N7511_006873 [Penicillium nucicola]KAJ5758179.1 hypothetical protein N7511_006873 [Penicillium nucicola]